MAESLYFDYTGASTSNTAPPAGAAGAGAQFLTAYDRAEIEYLIAYLNQPQTRVIAIAQFYDVYNKHNERRLPELGSLLWSSKDTILSLLEEISCGYRLLLLAPQLRMAHTPRICNALVLIQCMACHPEVRMELVKAEIPEYFYPYLNYNLPQFDYLRCCILGVIATFLKEAPGPNASMIVHYFLKIQTVPLCLGCMDLGGDGTKALASLILAKLLAQDEGKAYFGLSKKRPYAVHKVLSKMVDEFNGRPLDALLWSVLLCYLQLAQVPGCRKELKKHYPQKLRHFAYLNYICDESNRGFADLVLNYIMGEPQVQVVPPEDQLARMHI